MSKTGQRAGVALLLTVVGFALLWPEAEGGRLNPFEGGQYERIAFNMIHHGQYHDARQLGNGRARPPYVRRAPGYPLFLATVFALSPEFPSLTHACISDTQCDAAVPVRRRVQRLTALIAAVTVAAVFLVAHTWTGSWLISIAAWVFYLILLPSSYIASVLAACLLFVHAVLAAETWRRPRCVTGAISGVALGLLVLTKAVFQYWLVGVALVCAVGLWWDGSRRRALLPACLALLLGAGVVTLPWMMRNALQVEHFGISGRSGEVLAIRAEYGRMTWSEVRGAFAFWLPTNNAAVRETALQWLEPDEFGYRRFDRGNPAGFFRRTKNNTGEVAARADRLEPGWRQYQGKDQVAYDAVLARASADLIREDWLKQAVLTLAFLERGISIRPHFSYKNRFSGYLRPFLAPMTFIYGLAQLCRYLLLPAVGLMAMVAWRRRRFELGFLLLPVLYVLGIHALATHFEPRYAYPVVPLLVLVFAITAQEVWSCFHDKRDRSRTGPSDVP